MAEETQKSSAPEAPAAAAEAVVEKPSAAAAEKVTPPQPEPEKEAPEKSTAVEEAAEAEKPKAAEDEKKITQSVSFKEETNVVSELPESQKKALDELRALVQDALSKHEFKAPPPPAKEQEKPAAEKPSKAAEEPSKATVEKAPAAAEEEAAKAEEKSEASTEVIAEEAPKAEAEAPPAEAKKEEKAAEPSEPAVVAEVVETVTTAVVVDEDGAKTVEAIEESIVAFSPAPPAAEVKETEPKGETGAEEAPAAPPTPPEEVSIWGIPLLQDERSDVILLKFLRARDFKPKDAFAMIKNTVRWREEFKIEALLEEDLGANDFEKAVFMNGVDKEGHPVCYNVYGEFQNKELYQAAFSDEEKRQRFLRWRIQFLEKSIRKLDFSPTGISTIVQVNDLKNSPGPSKTGLRQTTNQALHLLQDNYPEFVAKQVFINVPWWYLAFNTVISPFLTQRTKSKFVFSGPSKSADTLFRYIAPEQVPVQYGGLNRDGEQEFTTADPATELIIKPASKATVEFPASEKGVAVWEARVLGWEVSYGSEFVPSAEDGYTVIVQKARKVAPADETVISGCYKIGDPGKVVLTMDNQTSKKKKLLYRSKTKPTSD